MNPYEMNSTIQSSIGRSSGRLHHRLLLGWGVVPICLVEINGDTRIPSEFINLNLQSLIDGNL